MDKEIIAEIKELFDIAESYTKSVEVIFGKGVVLPAINELRYCGKHLLHACISDEANEELRRAKSHCQRAIYDAAEAAALASLQTFDNFRDRFFNVQICDVISNYQVICENFQFLRKETSSRVDDEDKISKYKTLMELAQTAMSHLETLDSMEEELKKAQQRQEGKLLIQRKHLWMTAIGIFLTGIGAAAAIFAI